MSLNELRDAVHALAKEKGWYSFEGETRDQYIARCVASYHGEVSELWEAHRNHTWDAPCDKAAKMEVPLTCAQEEMADIIIRVLDTCGFLGIDIAEAVNAKHAYNATREFRHGGKAA